jgi:hypothetical protein
MVCSGEAAPNGVRFGQRVQSLDLLPHAMTKHSKQENDPLRTQRSIDPESQ